MGLPADSLPKLRRYVARRGAAAECSQEDAERKTQEEMDRIWREREAREAAQDPTFAEIPRFYARKPSSRAASTHSSSSPAPPRDEPGRRRALMMAEVERLARQQLQEHMVSLILEPAELDECWRLLRTHASPPSSPTDERINYDGFCRVAALLPPHAAGTFFCASHFLRLPLDAWGRVSVLHLFQWLRGKNALLRTRAELSGYAGAADGTLGERELEQWVADLLPQLPALSELREEFFPFYKVTAVRKFIFFLDPKRRGRISLHKLLSSPILHELLELRRPDIPPEELAVNWFSLEYAEMLYSDYLELDRDQNGMLSTHELMHFRGGAPPGGGLTHAFVQRVFQECHSYRTTAEDGSHRNELDYKSYLDFVLAHTYRVTPEALTYFFKLLDMRRCSRLSGFDVAFFFRAVLDRFDELGEEPNCTVADVQDEIFDMVKPQDPLHITLSDLINCKVGDTIVGMLTDAHAFYQYDRREELMLHDKPEN